MTAPDLTPTVEERRLAYGVAMARRTEETLLACAGKFPLSDEPWPRVTRTTYPERVEVENVHRESISWRDGDGPRTLALHNRTDGFWTYRIPDAPEYRAAVVALLTGPTTHYEVRYDLATDAATMHMVEAGVTAPPPAPVIPRAYRVAERMVRTLEDAFGGVVKCSEDAAAAHEAWTREPDSGQRRVRAALRVARTRAEASVHDCSLADATDAPARADADATLADDLAATLDYLVSRPHRERDVLVIERAVRVLRSVLIRREP